MNLFTNKSNKYKLIRSSFTSDLYNGYMYIGSDNISYNSFIDEIKTTFTYEYGCKYKGRLAI